VSTTVFANGRTVVAKSADGKAIAAFPDVCLSPPSPPAGPLPIPYPNTAMASDLTSGTTTVKANGKEIAKKDSSYFSTSSGDEAATKSLGMGVVTHQIQGKAYFTSWSMDVKVEGANVPRSMDLTTHNHASVPGNTATWPYIDSADPAMTSANPCKKEAKAKDDACAGATNKAERCADDDCRQAMKCELQPYDGTNTKSKGCCGKPNKQTPHHIVEVHCFTPSGGRAGGSRLSQFKKYDDGQAPCVCCDESSRFHGDHGSMHAIQNTIEAAHMDPSNTDRDQFGGQDGNWTYGAAKKGGIFAHKKTFAAAGCSDACIEAQLDAYHKKIGADDDTEVRADRASLNEEQKKIGGAPAVKRFIKKMGV
jgi:hypothetical protein